jgi:ABC-type polysaccharide/polyol phosphate export permease
VARASRTGGVRRRIGKDATVRRLMTATTTPAHYRTSARRLSPFGLVAEAIAEAWSRRRLIGYLVQADLKKKGADTILGNVWWVLDPLLQMLVYVILVSVIFARSQPDYPLFIFAAILPWKWFTSSIGDAIAAVTSQERLIKQVHFPKIVLPFAATVAGLVNFVFGLIGLGGLLLILFNHRISWTLLLLPAVVFVQFVFTLALTFAFSAVNVFYRDVNNLARHLLRLWFYLSPGLYAIDQIQKLGEHSRVLETVLMANPFAILFEAYRRIEYDMVPPDWTSLGLLLLASFALMAFTTYIFKRLEPSFAKVL